MFTYFKHIEIIKGFEFPAAYLPICFSSNYASVYPALLRKWQNQDWSNAQIKIHFATVDDTLSHSDLSESEAGNQSSISEGKASIWLDEPRFKDKFLTWNFI